MDAIELLEQQHQQVEDLLESFEEADADQRETIVAQVITHLLVHTSIEEEIFYPAVRNELGMEDQILEDLEEHHVVEVLLDELEGMTPSDERFAAKVEVLHELVEHHVEEEREELFPEVREGMSQDRLAELGEQMATRAAELESQAELDASTKEELYQRAQDLGVEGRSQMSKRELAMAVGGAAD